MDRRVPFFLVSAAVCGVLAPVADDKHRWVAVAAAITYLVLAGLTALDAWSKARRARQTLP